jgi:cobaltochelatase CobS
VSVSQSSAQAILQRLVDANQLTGDQARTLLKAAFTEAMSHISTHDAGVFARDVGRTLNAAGDYMPPQALLWATHCACVESPLTAAMSIAKAINDPANEAVANKRSKSGYGYGHHKNWHGNATPHQIAQSIAIHYALLMPQPSPPSSTPATNQGASMASTVNLNLATDVVLALSYAVAESDSLDSVVTKADLKSAVHKIVPVVATHYAIDQDEAAVKALEASIAITMDTLSDEALAEHCKAKRSHEDVAKIIDTIAPISTAEEAPMPAAASIEVPTVPAITVDPGLAKAVNALMEQATGGQVKDIEATLKTMAELSAKAQQLASELSRVRAQPVVSLSGGESKIDGATLTYEVVMRNCDELFPNPKSGRKMKQLKFEIPTLVWKDTDGNVVNHPLTPTVDQHYQFRLRHILKLATAFLMNKNVWAHGHTGTGKTTLVEQFYARLGFPVFRVNLDSNLERADLVGQKELSNDNGTTVTTFNEGVLPRAMTQPCALILDEIDAGRPDILFVIQRATEGNGLLLTEDGGRLVKPHPLFRINATANSRGQGDEFGVYAGVRPMNAAMLDRFGVMIEVDYLGEDEEEQFLTRAYSGIAADIVKQVVTFAKLVRDAFRNGEISLTLSPRGVKSIVELYSFYDGMLSKSDAIESAVEMVVIDRATADNRQRVLELRERAFKA